MLKGYDDSKCFAGFCKGALTKRLQHSEGA
jgi:hypothetical protein